MEDEGGIHAKCPLTSAERWLPVEFIRTFGVIARKPS